MAQRELRASRYLTKQNEPLARFITEELRYLDYAETLAWYKHITPALVKADKLESGAPTEWCSRALLGCNDRYYLLTGLLHRDDMLHPWLFDRCREIEAHPDGYIDLWARYHGKSSIVTGAGIIQELLVNPEITIAIFSVTKAVAVEFLGQIKNTFEADEHLKEVYRDVLYQNPRGKGPDGRPTKWSLARGITIKRKGRPKEANIEAHGLIDGQPTGRHFDMHVYDDVVTQDYLSDLQIKTTTARWEMADNLGTRHGVRKQIVGTRYHFADTYGVIIERKSAKPRIYAATDDGKLTGKLVLLKPEHWAKILNDQRSTISAQMLLNPIAGNEATFRSIWLRPYEIIPAVLNVYILVDPSKGTGERSDRTGIAVIGIDQASNKYLLDGYCHRMKLSERWEYVKALKRKWEAHPGVQMVKVGWERYGKDVELEVIETFQIRENNHFEIEELNTPRQGSHSKDDRIGRLEPDVRNGRFYLPCLVHYADGENPHSAGPHFWNVWTEEMAKAAEAKGLKLDYHVGQIIYRPRRAATKLQRNCEATGQKYRVVTELKRRDENKDVYDLTRLFVDELIRHPFAQYKDLIDAASRIFDIDPHPPEVRERQSTEPIGLDFNEKWASGDVDEGVDYGDTGGSMGRPL